MSSNIQIDRICEFCGKTFSAKTTKTRFCGTSCTGKFYKQKKRLEKIGASEDETKLTRAKQSGIDDLKNKEVFSVSDAAKYLSVSRPTIYTWLKEGKLKGKRVSNRKVLITRKNIDGFLDVNQSYEDPIKNEVSINELYTYEEIRKKYNVSLSWLYLIIEKQKIPRRKRSGIVYLPKAPIDQYFADYEKDIINIKAWYSIQEVVDEYGLTRDSIYGKCNTYGIPKKKDGRHVLISKKHFDELYKVEL